MEQVNLLPWRQLNNRRQQRRWYGMHLTLLLCMVLLFITLYALLTHARHLQQKRYLAIQQQQLANLPSLQLPPIAPILRQSTAQYLIKQLPVLVPHGVYLQQLYWQPQQIEIVGMALDYQHLAYLISNIEQQAKGYALRLEHVHSTNTHLTQVNFALQLQPIDAENRKKDEK